MIRISDAVASGSTIIVCLAGGPGYPTRSRAARMPGVGYRPGGAFSPRPGRRTEDDE